jgi:hypothetical protein
MACRAGYEPNAKSLGQLARLRDAVKALTKALGSAGE